MSLLGNIWVKLGLKSDDFQRGMDSAEKKSKTFGDTIKGVAKKVTAAIAAFKILAGTLKTITNFEAWAAGEGKARFGELMRVFVEFKTGKTLEQLAAEAKANGDKKKAVTFRSWSRGSRAATGS